MKNLAWTAGVVMLAVLALACGESTPTTAGVDNLTPPLPTARLVDLTATPNNKAVQQRNYPISQGINQLFALANTLPAGPQEVVFYSKRNETLPLIASWSGVPLAELTNRVEVKQIDRELPLNTPVPITLTADELDRFEDTRQQYHTSYQTSFFEKHAVSETKQVTVKRGDSLWKLARMGEIPVPLWLMEKSNPGKNIEVLQPGDVLEVPILIRSTGGAPTHRISKPASRAIPAPSNNSITTTLSDRAPRRTLERLETSQSQPNRAGAKQRRAAKEQTTAPIKPHTLAPTRPALPVAPATRTQMARQHEPLTIRVQPGESLYLYSRWAGLSISKLVAYNQLSAPDRLKTGQSIQLPISDHQVATFYQARRQHLQSRGEPDAATKARGQWTTHVVSSGENAWNIAVKRYQISLEELGMQNPGLDLSKLSPGTILKIPVSATTQTDPR